MISATEDGCEACGQQLRSVRKLHDSRWLLKAIAAYGSGLSNTARMHLQEMRAVHEPENVAEGVQD
jgi:hypothetical protein